MSAFSPLLPGQCEPENGQTVTLAYPGVNEWGFEEVKWNAEYWSQSGLVATKWMAASGMEARQGRDAAERLDGKAATARPDAQPLEPKD